MDVAERIHGMVERNIREPSAALLDEFADIQIPIREKYKYLNLEELILQNSQNPGWEHRLIDALTALYFCGLTLLEDEHRRRREWRFIRYDDVTYSDKLRDVQGCKPILSDLGYKHEKEKGLLYAHNEVIAPEKITALTADIVLAKAELLSYLSAEPGCEDGISKILAPGYQPRTSDSRKKSGTAKNKSKKRRTIISGSGQGETSGSPLSKEKETQTLSYGETSSDDQISPKKHSRAMGHKPSTRKNISPKKPGAVVKEEHATIPLGIQGKFCHLNFKELILKNSKTSGWEQRLLDALGLLRDYAVTLMDKESKRRRGWRFIRYDDEEYVEKLKDVEGSKDVLYDMGYKYEKEKGLLYAHNEAMDQEKIKALIAELTEAWAEVDRQRSSNQNAAPNTTVTPDERQSATEVAMESDTSQPSPSRKRPMEKDQTKEKRGKRKRAKKT